MAGMEGVWRDMASRHGLVEPDLDRIASWWHTDGDLGRNIEVLTDMNKSRDGRVPRGSGTPAASFFDYVERYRRRTDHPVRAAPARRAPGEAVSPVRPRRPDGCSLRRARSAVRDRRARRAP